jgi:replicative DNA helicase
MDRKETRSDIGTVDLQYGKLPPQAVDVEEVVLGAMILERNAFLNNPVKTEWFYKEEHQKIIQCLDDLRNSSISIDLIHVTKRLRDLGLLEDIGGPSFLMRLTKKVSSAVHIEQHIRIIQQEYARRELIRVSCSIQNKSHDGSIDIDDIFSDIQREMSSIMSFGDDKSISYADASNNLIERLNSDIELGIKTGIYKYDKFTGGFHLSDLVLIAAETSQGKTSLALTMLKNCALRGHKAAIFSLEMTKEQLVARITSQQTGIGAKQIMYNKINPNEKTVVINNILSNLDLPIFFDEDSTNDIDKICTSIRKLKIKHDIELVLVDYIQDMKGAKDEAGIADIGRKLKNIAKELNICVVAVSQLSRDKLNPEPNRARLRGSGQLEEKADIVLLLYRPEEYNREYSEPHENTPVCDTAQIKIAKGRNVGTGSFIVGFNRETTNFYDYIDNEFDGIPREF